MRGLDYLFHPRSIAIVGASADPSKRGYTYLAQLRDFGYLGGLYPVNPKGGTIMGVPVYPSLTDIPGDVDYVISAVPAEKLPMVIEECARKGVKVLQLFTAHLGETGETEMEKRIVEQTRRAGIRLLGPNCMGVYSPQERVTFRFGWNGLPGPISFISQSAGHTSEVVYQAQVRGLGFNKVVSYGNAADITESELLSYLAHDPQTGLIAAYIEGVKDPDRFPIALREAAEHKPVIVIKVGRTPAGTRATRSHTASLSGSDSVIGAVIRQSGAIRVDTLEELVDMLVAFNYLSPPTGRSIAAIGSGGGGSVLICDECEAQGLSVPPLPAQVESQLQLLLGDDWSLIKNPVDTSVVFPAGYDFSDLRLIFQYMANHPDYHMLIGDNGEWWLDEPDDLIRYKQLTDTYIQVMGESFKPGAVVVRHADCLEEWRWRASMEAMARCAQARLPVFPTIRRAATALSRFASYHLDHTSSP
ncbi:MAG: CoA-binding protein [Dehalococcoidia bacterium]|nr:CoA-binding protein [Dehalococcoidia bacterium]